MVISNALSTLLWQMESKLICPFKRTLGNDGRHLGKLVIRYRRSLFVRSDLSVNTIYGSIDTAFFRVGRKKALSFETIKLCALLCVH